MKSRLVASTNRCQFPALLCAIVAGSMCSIASAQSVTRESVSGTNSPVEGNGVSREAAISADGNTLVFRTTSDNWPDGSSGLNATRIIKRNRTTGSTQMLNGSGIFESPPLSGERPSNGLSRLPSYRGAGAAWLNDADQNPGGFLCPDNNGLTDIYFNSGTPTAWSWLPGGGGCGVSPNGQCISLQIYPDNSNIAFETTANNLGPTDTNNFSDIYSGNTSGSRVFSKKSVAGSILTGIVHADGASSNPSVGGSSTTRWVTAFESLATNLTTDTNGLRDIYARVEPQGGGLGFPFTTRVSVSSAGTQANGASFAPNVSKDGRFVVFSSDANNLVTGDTNGQRDIFLRDLTTNTTTRLSLAMNGAQPNAACNNPVINADGTWVAFESTATNLIASVSTVAGRSHIYLCHVPTGSIFMCDFNNATFSEANNSSFLPSISDDGLTVAFETDATNLIDSDLNAKRDIYVYSRSNAPVNDECANAVELSGVNVVLVGGSTGGAFASNAVNSCGLTQYSPDVWYKYTAACTGPYQIDTAGSNFDTVLTIYSDCGQTVIQCDDDGGTNNTSKINRTLIGGETYWIRVAGYTQRSGNFNLQIQALGLPAVDNCFSGFTASVGTRDFVNCNTTSTGPVITGACNGVLFGTDVWYEFNPTSSGTYTIDTIGSSFDTVMAVYQAPNCGSVSSANQIACNDDLSPGIRPSLVNINATAGLKYFVRIGGYNSAVGNGRLNISYYGCNPADIANDQGTPLPGPNGIPNNGVNEGDYNAFFAADGFFLQSGLGADAIGMSCDIADDQGTPFPPFGTGGLNSAVNNGVNEGDYNCFFNYLFIPCN